MKDMATEFKGHDKGQIGNRQKEKKGVSRTRQRLEKFLKPVIYVCTARGYCGQILYYKNT